MSTQGPPKTPEQIALEKEMAKRRQEVAHDEDEEERSMDDELEEVVIPQGRKVEDKKETENKPTVETKTPKGIPKQPVSPVSEMGAQAMEMLKSKSPSPTQRQVGSLSLDQVRVIGKPKASFRTATPEQKETKETKPVETKETKAAPEMVSDPAAEAAKKIIAEAVGLGEDWQKIIQAANTRSDNPDKFKNFEKAISGWLDGQQKNVKGYDEKAIKDYYQKLRIDQDPMLENIDIWINQINHLKPKTQASSTANLERKAGERIPETGARPRVMLPQMQKFSAQSKPPTDDEPKPSSESKHRGPS